MAKYFGNVGFEIYSTHKGISEAEKIIKQYRGDVLRHSRKNEPVQQTRNDDLMLSIQLSIVADSFILTNYFNIVYVEFENAKWKVRSVDIQRPRLILELGGLYNG